MNLFYTLIIGLPIFASLWSTQCSLAKKYIHRVSTFCLAVLLALRNNVGADYPTYKAHYEAYFTGMPNVKFTDVGYEFMNKIFGTLGVPYKIFLFLTGIFIIHSFYRYLEESEIKHEFIPTILYFLIFDVFIYSLSAIRQSIAIGCLFFALIYARHNARKKAFGIFILGCLFHWSLLFLVPILMLCHKFRYVKFSLLIALIPLSSILYYAFTKSTLWEMFAGINHNLTVYLILEQDKIVTYSVFTLILYILFVFAWIFLIMFFNKCQNTLLKFKKIRNCVYEMSIEEWFVYIFFLSKIWLIIQYNSSLPRLEMYLYFLLPFAFGKVAEKINGEIKYITYFVMFSLLIISFISKLNANYAYYGYASLLL